MGIVHLLLGGNSGDRSQYLSAAIAMIGEEVGVVTNRSSVYETEPWGFEAEMPFLNQAVRVETGLTPQETLLRLKRIEQRLGRVKNSAGYESRVIDIDILVFDDLQVSEKELQIPHPRLHLRKFTLVPLAEIAGDLKHPVLNSSFKTLNSDCKDPLNVQLFSKG